MKNQAVALAIAGIIGGVLLFSKPFSPQVPDKITVEVVVRGEVAHNPGPITLDIRGLDKLKPGALLPPTITLVVPPVEGSAKVEVTEK